MKTLTSLSLSLVLMGSTAYAGGGLSRMAGPEITSRSSTVVRKFDMPNSYKKRHISTKGFKPQKGFEPKFEVDNITKEKVIFVDQSHERYYRPTKNQQSTKEKVGSVQQKDDHTLEVKLS